jgi:AcrR family transcriptional regulator
VAADAECPMNRRTRYCSFRCSCSCTIFVNYQLVGFMARPKKTQARETKEQAIKAADALLHKYGYLGVSMDAIAEAVGVRKASLYHHFPEGKDELMLELAERLVRQEGGGFQRAIDSKTTAQGKLEAISFFFFEANVQTDRILRDALRFMPEGHQAVMGGLFYKEMYGKIHGVFEEGVANKEFRKHDTEFSSWAFLGLISELNTLEPRDNRKRAKQVVDLIINGLKP